MIQLLNSKNVMVELEKNLFMEMEKDKAIEFACNEYFNGNIVKLNGKEFDVMQYGIE